MQTEYIIIKEYCQKTNIDPTFIILLEEGGLIDTYIEEGEKCFPLSQLTNLEKYSRMYYDLSINVEGIEAINHILGRMTELQKEVSILRKKLRLYEPDDF